MEPDNYFKNGSLFVFLVRLIDINYTYHIHIEMFIFGFNKYGELDQMFENGNFRAPNSSLIACYRNKKIINKGKFSNGLKLIKIDEI